MTKNKEPLITTERSQQSTVPPSIKISSPFIYLSPYLYTRIPNIWRRDANNALYPLLEHV